MARPTKTASSSRTPPAGAGADPHPTVTPGKGLRRADEPKGGGALFLGDVAGAIMLANEARYRTLQRVLGIRREDANLATVMGVLTVANSVYERAHRPKPPKPPTAVADLTIGTGVLRELIYGVAGSASEDTPLGGTLIAIGILVGLTRPPVRQGLHEIRASSQRLKHSFRGRYGHLVKIGRRN